LLVFAFLQGYSEQDGLTGALDGCLIPPGSFQIMFMAFNCDMAVVFPMGKVFDRRYILGPRDTTAHDFLLKCKVNPDA